MEDNPNLFIYTVVDNAVPRICHKYFLYREVKDLNMFSKETIGVYQDCFLKETISLGNSIYDSFPAPQQIKMLLKHLITELSTKYWIMMCFSHD